MELDVHDYYDEHVDQALSGDYTVHGDTATADCVIAAAFGYQEQAGQVRPGLSNQAMAGFIAEHYPQLPKILQQEVADAYDDSGSGGEVVGIGQATKPGQRLDTPDLIIQARQTMGAHGWRRAVIVAHPNHVPWVDFLAGRAGITTVVPAGLQVIPFDSKSAQYWTRSLAAWQREVRARHQSGDPRRPVREV
jgi:hypothetical protein